MDRLSPVATLALAALLIACNDEKARPQGSRDRVNAVQARPTDRPTPAAMCDVFHTNASAPTFIWPKLAGDWPAAREGEWRWINVWASWCKPCVKELPRLMAWRGRLGKRGLRVALHLVSADESDDEISSFRKAHPTTPPSLRLAAPEGLPAWMKRLGVPGASLPVHVFVDPAGRVRCVRASAVENTDYPAIEALLRDSPP